MRRHRSNNRVLIITFVLLIGVYFCYTGYTLASLAFPSTESGVAALETGEQQLPTNPAAASQSFTQASQDFETSFQQLKKAPPWIKLATPLPPFRWQIRFLKALHDLSVAGNQAAALSASAPPVHLFDQPLPTSLPAVAAAYFSWLNVHPTDLSLFENQLADAHRQLDGIPSWVMLGQKSQVETLRNQVAAADRLVSQSVTLSQNLEQSLGRNDTSSHSWLLLWQDNRHLRPDGGTVTAYARLVGSGGTIRTVEFPDQPFPVQLDSLTPGFLPDQAAQLAAAYSRASGEKPEGIIFINNQALENWLQAVGGVTLPDGQVVRSTTLTSLLDNSPHPNSFFELLLTALSQKEGNLPSLASAARESIASKSLRFWSSQESLEKLFPTDSPPTAPNWARVITADFDPTPLPFQQTVQVDQLSKPLDLRSTQRLTITRTLISSPPAGYTGQLITQVYLPASATVTESPVATGTEAPLSDKEVAALGNPTAIWPVNTASGPGWKSLTFPSTVRFGTPITYSLTYTLPKRSGSDTFFTFLKQAGLDNERFEGFGYSGPVTGDLHLEK